MSEKLDQKMTFISVHPVLRSLLAGSFSGTCTTIIFQPLDLVKTRIQNSRPGHRPGMMAVAQKVFQNESFAGLWRGLVPSLARTVPGVGLYFASLHGLKSLTVGPKSKSSLYQNMALGAVARTITGVVLIPATVIKTRFESGTYHYRRIFGAFGEIYMTEGFRGLSCGLIPTLIRDAPFSGIYLMIYMRLKEFVVPSVNSSSHYFVCGLGAGFLASLFTHPADVVKTHMQLHPESFPTVRQAANAVYLLSGFRGFMVGLAPRLVRRTMMAALTWTVFEEVERRIRLK